MNSMSLTVSRLLQAQAHAEADPRPTTIKLWRDGVAVEMWDRGRRVERRVTWEAIETAHLNVVMEAIYRCAADLSARHQ